jgi:VWFA-related protein
MTARTTVRLIGAFLLAIPAVSSVAAQSSGVAGSQRPDYTIREYARAVLTDVTVTDRYGNPVTGLKSSDFEVSDDGAPQSISSFKAHLAPGAEASESIPGNAEPGVYSNTFMLHLPPVLNIVLIDVASYSFPDVGYAWYELNRFIQRLPADEPIAIYVRASDTVMLQPFTSDRALLLAAVRRAVYRYPLNAGLIPGDEVTLHAIASDMGQFPGRKNVLWFTGGLPFMLRADGSFYQDQGDMRQIYDELEAARIAVYPIDVRGVEPFSIGSIRKAGVAPGTIPVGPPPEGHQHLENIAKATGGRAFYNDNALDAIAARVVSSDGDYYTLSYSPSGVRFDGRWHRVQVTLRNSKTELHLSYRQGYFADDRKDLWDGGKDEASNGRKRLAGVGPEAEEQPNPWSMPIIFRVTALPVAAMASNQLPAEDVLPSPAMKQKKRSIPYVVRYALPANEVTVTTNHGIAQVEIGVMLVALDEDGDVVAREADHVTLSRSESDLDSDPNQPILIEQRAHLPKGENDLFCEVWDMASHRLGSIQIPIKVTKKAE